MAALTSEQIRFIESLSVARLATVDPAGFPHAVPICFGVGSGNVYSAIDHKPKRTVRRRHLSNIERTGHAAVLFDRYDAVSSPIRITRAP